MFTKEHHARKLLELFDFHDNFIIKSIEMNKTSFKESKSHILIYFFTSYCKEYLLLFIGKIWEKTKCQISFLIDGNLLFLFH